MSKSTRTSVQSSVDWLLRDGINRSLSYCNKLPLNRVVMKRFYFYDTKWNAFYHIHRIGLIRNYLDQRATARLVSAFFLSPLDNGNSFLLGLPGKQLDRLQSVQNSVVRLINRTSRMEHITPKLAALHWLPIRYRIDFKVPTLTFRCVQGMATAYLMELVSLQTATRSGLPSEKDTLKLVVLPAKKV